MATLYITEFSNAAMAGLVSPTSAFPLPAPLVSGDSAVMVEQHVTIGGSTTQSAAVAATTTFVMLNCDNACSLAWGTNPTAVATAQRMGANETRFYGVPPGKAYKVAVITNS